MSEARAELPDDDRDDADAESETGIERNRADELATNKGSKLYRDLIETFEKVRQGFQDQQERADDIFDNWDLYNCVLGPNQAYNGNASIFVPIVKNAVNARKTRFVNQIFPSSGRYIDAASDDGSIPYAVVALLEHYIRKVKLRTQIAMALVRNGDLEGQYNLYVDWNELTRNVVSRETRPAQVAMPGMGAAEMPGDEVETIVEEELTDAFPAVEVLHDTDVLVTPPTADSVEDALAQGGEVTIIRRWTKATIRQKIKDGELIKRFAEDLLDNDNWGEDRPRSAAKEMVDAAGIHGSGGKKHALIYETWKCINLGKDGRRLCRIYYGGYNIILSARRNPYWNDRCPLLSVPVDKIAGAFKGQAPVEGGVKTLQWHANDIANEAADSSLMSMMPILIADPLETSGPLLINLGAIWKAKPNSIQFAQFPKLWQDGIQLIQADMQTIFQTLGVNPAMLPQQTGRPGQKRNQAEVALETTVDVLTTAEACSTLEEGIFTPLVERFAEYDAQFRDDEITVRAYGELGLSARMERIAPRQQGNRLTFTWFGVEQARNAQQMQQQIAWFNVVRGMDQQLKAAGYTVDPAPALEVSAQNLFGARLGRLVLKDSRAQLSVKPEEENELLLDGFEVSVNPQDQDQQHVQVHRQAMAQGDLTGAVRVHIQRHLQQMQLKSAAAMMQQQAQQGGAPGGPPGGAPGAPQPGAMPAGPRLLKGPPGMIPRESMPRAGVASLPPRRA
jgi:hypothetical protein